MCPLGVFNWIENGKITVLAKCYPVDAFFYIFCTAFSGTICPNSSIIPMYPWLFDFDQAPHKISPVSVYLCGHSTSAFMYDVVLSCVLGYPSFGHAMLMQVVSCKTLPALSVPCFG